MSEITERIFQKGIQIGRELAQAKVHQSRIEVYINLVREGVSEEIALRCLHLEPEDVRT